MGITYLTKIKSESIKKLKNQIIKSSMDVLILTELRNSSMSGYDAISFIHERFGVLLSSGTVYSHIYSLERNGLVKGHMDEKKRVYSLTEMGEDFLKDATKTNLDFIESIKDTIINLKQSEH